MAITAAQVNELRKRTGLAMMQCKKKLEETGGDVEAAIEAFRKEGVKTKVAEREAGEGRVSAYVNDDATRGVIVEVRCNTDFTARNEIVAEICDLAGKKLLADASADPAADEEIKSKLTDVSQQTGENVQLGRTVSVEGTKVGRFNYTVSNKVAALVAVDSAGVADEVLSDICLHLVAFKPVAEGLTRDDVDPALVAKEKEIAVEQAKATGKPQEIAEKIADGKMNAFYRERVLSEQDFINPDKHKGTVADYAKKAGGTLTGYQRLEVGG
ncbi:MAG: translation elongation factor Ts [Planctomycetota bacterium]